LRIADFRLRITKPLFINSQFKIRNPQLHGGFLSVALSRSLRMVGVTHRRVLWSPDFPLHGIGEPTPRNGRPADIAKRYLL